MIDFATWERTQQRNEIAIADNVVCATATVSLMFRLVELLDGCNTVEDVLDNMVEQGAYVADPEESPLTDWINAVVPDQFDKIEYDWTDSWEARNEPVTMWVHCGKTYQSFPLPYLLSEVVTLHDGGHLVAAVRNPDEFGFEFIEGAWQPVAKKAA